MSFKNKKYYNIGKVKPYGVIPSMFTSTLTVKGQVTIPVEIRRLLNLKSGDQVTFTVDNNRIALERRECRIEAAFGLLKAERSVSLEEMEQAIRARRGAP